jgi:hypothetical protein
VRQVSELIGAELDYWVARSETKGTSWEDNENWIAGYLDAHSPSTNWNDAGVIIDRLKISIYFLVISGYWIAL